MLVGLVAAAPPAMAEPLPDNRGYELVSHIVEEGNEGGLNGAEPFFAATTAAGGTVDWQAAGACCGASSGEVNMYQSQRGSGGWQVRAITPTPSEPLSGLEELQEAVFWTEDLTQTIFSTPASYASGDKRPTGSGGNDLYLQGPTGVLKWVSQGPSGTGTGAYPTRFDAATPNAAEVLFSTAEPLTANANGLASAKWEQYLYARDVAAETTTLVDVDNSGHMIGPYGATLGDAGPPKEGLFSFNYPGSTTHAVSQDGSKIVFETPPAKVEGLPEGVKPHLYMRDLATTSTTPLDDPASTGSARFEGAAADGSLVFFTSDEGLAGASHATELYEFNTTATPIGSAPPMVAVPLASGAGITGVTAIANNGSRVFFVARDVLASNANSADRMAVATEPNLYVYDTASGVTQYVTTLAPPDVSSCKPTCANTELSGLVGEPDIFRPAYPTPGGSVLVFTSSGDLAGEDRTPTTTLTSEAAAGEHTITVASTAGFLVGHTIAIDAGEAEELETIEKITSPTELTLSEYGPAVVNGLVNAHAAGASVTELNSEVYRYSTPGGTLRCLSCTPPGVLPTQSATLGETGGGSYAPAGYAAQMSEDGSRVFFDSPDPLLAGMTEANTDKQAEPANVYEWENGHVFLIANAAANGSVFHGTTPSGDDLFFSTRSPLVPGNTTGYEHIYDARVNGGFSQEPPVGNPCASEACRPFSAATPFFPVPSSATVSEPSVAPVQSMSGATFTVSKITAAQRAKFARTGRLTLTARATAPSDIVVSATGELRGKLTRLAHAKASIRAAGKVTIALRLSAAARTELARNKILPVRLEVTYGATGAIVVADLTLRTAGKKQTTSRRHRRHA